MRSLFFTVVILSCLFDCSSSDDCVVNSTRCNGNFVEICNASKSWQALEDCDKISALNGGNWKCAPPEMDLPAACLQQ